MKIWGWFVFAALWLGAVVATTFDFAAGRFGGFSVSIETGKWLPEQLGFPLAAVLLYLILFGWLIPLSIGFLRTVLSLKNR